MDDKLREAQALLSKVLKAQAVAYEAQAKANNLRDDLLFCLQSDEDVAKVMRKKCYVQTRIRRATTPEIEEIEEQIADKKARLYEQNMEKIRFLQSEAQMIDEAIDELTTDEAVAELEEKLFLLRDKTKLPPEALRAAQSLVIRSDEQ